MKSGFAMRCTCTMPPPSSMFLSGLRMVRLAREVVAQKPTWRSGSPAAALAPFASTWPKGTWRAMQLTL